MSPCLYSFAVCFSRRYEECPCGFSGILYHSITLCLVGIEKHNIRGVIDAGFMYHTSVTPVSPFDIETGSRYCFKNERKHTDTYLREDYFVNIRCFIAESKLQKSGKQAEMFKNTPIFRLSTPGSCRSVHPDVRNGYTRMYRIISR